MLLLPSTRFSSRILSTVLSLLVTTTFFCQPGHAFPDLAGLVKERRGASHAHHQHHDAGPIDKREAAGGGGAGEEEAAAAARELYARQLGALTGLLGSTVSELGTTNGLNDLGLGSLVGPMGTFPLDTFEKYPWEPPGPNDQRGPCPAVNAMANHHIISHTGVVSTWELLRGAVNTFNLGFDMALLTVIAATLSGGDPVTWTLSIGGPDPRVEAPLGGLLGLLGQPQGLEHTHNLIEVDASMTRNDIYDTGDAWTMNIDLFRQFYNSVPEGELFTHEAIVSASCLRWHQTVASSPNFYYGAGTGYFRNFAQMALLLWGNHSDGTLDGQLTHEIVYSLYGVTSDPEPFTYRFGHERIPDNWYRRPEPFDIAGHLQELLQWFGWCPALASIGGNLGQVNTFTPVDGDDLASGLGNASKLLEGNNFFCFILELLKVASPSFTNEIYSSLFGIIGDLGCPQADALAGGAADAPEYVSDMKSKYPGAQVGSAF